MAEMVKQDKELTMAEMVKQETIISCTSDEMVGGGSPDTSPHESDVFEFHGEEVAHKLPCQSYTTTQSMEEEKMDLPQPEGPGESKPEISQGHQAFWIGSWRWVLNNLTHNFSSVLPPNGRWSLYFTFLVYAAIVTGVQPCDQILTRKAVQNYDRNFVDLSGMQLSGIETDACDFSQTVSFVDFSDNCLSNLPQLCFNNSESLHEVNLANNSFYSHPPALKNAKSLLKEDMSDNPIKYLAKDDFEGKDQVTVIKFARCNIESIHPLALNQLESLKIVDFSENKLASIPCKDLMTTLVDLRQMDLSNNLLESLNIACFSRSQGVRNISISDDKMIVWTADYFIEFVISGNSGTFNCEKIEEEILNANLPVDCTLSCQFQNGSAGHVALQVSGKYHSTSVTPSGHDLSTPPSDTVSHNGVIVALTVLCIVLFLFIVAALIYIFKLRKAAAVHDCKGHNGGGELINSSC